MGLIDSIKKCQKDQINNMQLTNVVIGVVTSIEPLEIDVDQKYILTEKQLILSRNVTDYEFEMTVEHKTEDHTHTHDIEVIDTYTSGGSGEIEEETHNHEYKGRKTFLVHNALKVGEKVILIKANGGQKFFVIDRQGDVE